MFGYRNIFYVILMLLLGMGINRVNICYKVG